MDVDHPIAELAPWTGSRCEIRVGLSGGIEDVIVERVECRVDGWQGRIPLRPPRFQGAAGALVIFGAKAPASPVPQPLKSQGSVFGILEVDRSGGPSQEPSEGLGRSPCLQHKGGNSRPARTSAFPQS